MDHSLFIVEKDEDAEFPVVLDFTAKLKPYGDSIALPSDVTITAPVGLDFDTPSKALDSNGYMLSIVCEKTSTPGTYEVKAVAVTTLGHERVLCGTVKVTTCPA